VSLLDVLRLDALRHYEVAFQVTDVAEAELEDRNRIAYFTRRQLRRWECETRERWEAARAGWQADRDTEVEAAHEQAKELWERYRHLMNWANQPDIVTDDEGNRSWGDTFHDAGVAALNAGVDRAEAALDEHLIANRDLLEGKDRWASFYADIDERAAANQGAISQGPS
jgi:hypothetical protein